MAEPRLDLRFDLPHVFRRERPPLPRKEEVGIADSKKSDEHGEVAKAIVATASD